MAICLGLVPWSWSHSAAAEFSDVPSSHPYAPAISYVRDQGIVSGYSDGSFKPNNTINRAEFLKILLEAVLDDETINGCTLSSAKLFSDVPRREWFAKYVCTGKEAEVIGGYSDGTFRPANEITFAEAAKIISISFDLVLGPGETWYEPYVNALGAQGAIPDTISGPEKKITRAEMAEMIYRLKTDEPSVPSTSTTTQDSLSAFKQEVIELVNQERAKENLSPLRYNAFLEKSAQAHSDDMQARDYFEHNTPEGLTAEDRIKAHGYLDEFEACACTKSYSVGENLAKGQTTPTEALDTWMHSPQHRDNILNPKFSEIGIGMSKITEENAGHFEGYFWVQNFGDVKLEK